ncbi:putative transcriptional regulator YdeE [Tumebacillus sp. BK434]|uniref:GyrI-like domain-containing protein n=1 Tax=Tumebacillus sp. BK434 TaxID=2512169 RepID=UPI001051A78E|nr:GyrI-like domain-containing protein [Tumebacillus sp. BK434]TCP53908.1 putative transcriptional regulator YdeE [Tumebacillus sp. BK434]
MNITIVELPEKKLIGVKFAGPFDVLPIEMPKLWTIFLERVAEIPQVVAGAYYEISDEDFKHKIYTEYLTVEVERFDTIPYGMLAFALPARQYLKATHRGPMSSVQDTYLNLFKWMKENGYEQDLSALRMERYDRRFLPTVDDHAREENEYEILIPIKYDTRP